MSTLLVLDSSKTQIDNKKDRDRGGSGVNAYKTETPRVM